jgi:uncharacterized protein (DUF4415 family)
MKQKKAVRRKKKAQKATAKKPLRLMAVADGTESASDANARFYRFYKPRKVPVTIRLDADVVAWFKQLPGRKYQTRINEVLRRVMEEEADGA